jgi:hypothetical protein
MTVITRLAAIAVESARGTRGRRRQGRFYPMAQARGRRIAQRRGQHALLQLAIGTKSRRATRATLQMCLDVAGVSRIQLAVEQGME